jgi:hypothetical protein
MLKRNIQILFRVNAEEHDHLKSNAKKCGLSVARYLRFLIRGYVPKQLPPPDYYGMIRQLQAIGNSVNQIAARANATGFYLKDEYAKYAEDLRAAILNVQEAVTQPERINGDDKDMGG